MTGRAAKPVRLADRLARTLMLWVGGVWLACVLGVTWYVDHQINENFDNELVETAHRMIDIAVHDLDAASEGGTLDPAALPLLGRQPVFDQHPIVFQLVDRERRLLMRSAQAPPEEFRVKPSTGFEDSGPWRIYTVAHPVRPLVMHLADPIADRLGARNRILFGLALPLVGSVPLLVLLLRRIARRELRVLRDLEAEIGKRGGADLSAIALDAMPSELQSVGERVNRLLDRLSHALATERALAANAAHELRTPLAAVRLRLQTALDEGLSRRDVQAALDSLTTFGHRAEKLLQLSRAESSSAFASRSVDLVKMAATVAEEFWSTESLRHRLDLHIDEAGVCRCRGDVDSLAIALRNLVENALRYSGDAPVVIEVCAPCELVVRDQGPGVQAGTLETLRHRHARQTADAAGYGLGLSIVASIVEKHGSTLLLTSPPAGLKQGFEARIALQPFD